MIYIVSALCILAIVFGIMGFMEQYMLEVNTIDIEHKVFCKDEKVIFFADFHNISNEKYINIIIEKIKCIDSKKIFICGDLIVGKKGYDNRYAVSFLEKILDLNMHEVYFTYGNHESRLVERGIEEQYYLYNYFEELEKTNERFHLVNNKTIEIQLGGSVVCLSGILFEEAYYFKKIKPDINVINEKIGMKQDKYTIVMCHNPDFFKYFSEYGADIVLSGHNHGGIVRLPVIGGLVSTSGKPFPKYSAGIYREKDTKMALTKGLGTHTIKFRLFNKPEIMVLKFK